MIRPIAPHIWLLPLFLFAQLSVLPIPRASAEPAHGIAMHGKPQLNPGFHHLPYANPTAPKGGSIRYGVTGTFDSLNPYIVKSLTTSARGIWDPLFGLNVFEPLLHRSRDEPFSLYGLIAETVETNADRTWVEFHIRPQARFSDGQPVTRDDVIFSYQLLGEKGRPLYRQRMKKVDRIEPVGENGIRLVFNDRGDRELPLLLGMMPVFPKHATDAENFDKSTLKPPIGSGPYIVDRVEPGRLISYKRDPNYWGADLPVKRGLDNFDEIKVEYFRNESTRFEAFKKGLFDVFFENDSTRWNTGYDIDGVRLGDITRRSIARRTPAHMYCFVFNTRNLLFRDHDVRSALSKLFDFEWVNANLFSGTYTRSASFWHGSELSSFGLEADPREREILEPYISEISAEFLDGSYAPTISDGSGEDREIMREAFVALRKRGFMLKDRKLVDDEGEPVSFEILVSSRSQERLALAYRGFLAPLGIEANVRMVDTAQYQRRKQTFDYDMILNTYSASLSPGAEQTGRWGTATRDVEGTYNFVGTADPAIDATINALLAARSRKGFISAVRAFDRVLMSGHYVVPLFHRSDQWLAYRSRLGVPETVPLYGTRLPTWWRKTGQ